MPAHALLGPSGASIWTVCTRSPRFTQDMPDRESDYAAEGTLAHSIAELMIAYKLKRISKQKYNQELNKCKKHKLFDKEMIHLMGDYSDTIVEKYAKALAKDPKALLFQETMVRYDKFVPEGFGRLDVGMTYLNVIEVDDLKYGKGVPVDAVENKQMRIYALGLLQWLKENHPDIYAGVDIIKVNIHQPRLNSYTKWQLNVGDLMLWVKTVVVPAAKLAWAGEGEFVPGKHCQFCKGRPVCKANADYQLELAKHDFAVPEKITDEDLVDILLRADDFKGWLKSVQDYALHEAVTNKKKFPGLKLVEGISRRAYTNIEDLQRLLKLLGFSENDYLKKDIVGVTEMQKLMPKSLFSTTVEKYLIKPRGKPTLVDQATDKPEYDLNTAAGDFKEIED